LSASTRRARIREYKIKTNPPRPRKAGADRSKPAFGSIRKEDDDAPRHRDAPGNQTLCAARWAAIESRHCRSACVLVSPTHSKTVSGMGRYAHTRAAECLSIKSKALYNTTM